MTLKAVTPLLTTPDLDASIEFYTNVLGFTCTARSDEYGWAHVQRNGVSVMFGTPSAHIPFSGPVFTGSLYFYPEDVDAEWERLRDTAKVCYPIEDFDYGMREFTIYDDNRYLL